jgi:hypothetical protein
VGNSAHSLYKEQKTTSTDIETDISVNINIWQEIFLEAWKHVCLSIRGKTHKQQPNKHEIIMKVVKRIENNTPKKAKYQKFWNSGILL